MAVHVHTWADNYGVWHASLPEHALADPAAAARRAIRRELTLREPRNFDARVIGVSLHERRKNATGGHTLVYRETRNRLR